jgi:AbrB family looped-hinge helix DNA binding protein
MNTTAKIQHKGQVTIPTSVRRQAGLSKGDLVKFTFARGRIVITPKLVIDRSKFPNADDEYTPAQRRIIDARLAKSDEDIKHSRVYGPFDTHQEFIASLEKEIANLRVSRPIATGPRKNRKQAFLDLAATVAEVRQEAKEKGIDKMSMREINAAVAAARRDLKKNSKHPMK